MNGPLFIASHMLGSSRRFYGGHRREGHHDYATVVPIVTFMHWGSGDPNWVEYVEQTNPDIDVEVISVPQAYDDRLYSMLIGGTPPGIFGTRPDNYVGWARAGVLENLTPYVEADPLLRENIIPLERERSTVDGSIYGLGPNWGHMQLFYNSELFAQAGIAPPGLDAASAWSWDEFVHIVRRLTERGPDGVSQWGFAVNANHHLRYASMLSTFGTMYWDSMAERYTFDDDQVAVATQALADLIQSRSWPQRHQAICSRG